MDTDKKSEAPKKVDLFALTQSLTPDSVNHNPVSADDQMKAADDFCKNAANRAKDAQQSTAGGRGGAAMVITDRPTNIPIIYT